MKKVAFLFIVLAQFSFASGHDADGTSRQSKGYTADAIDRMLQNPEKFLRDEKQSYLDGLQKTDPAKAAEARRVFESYEKQLSELNENLKKAERSFNDAINEGKIRERLSRLEEDLRKVMKGSPAQILNELKDKLPKNLTPEELEKLGPLLNDNDLAKALAQLSRDIDGKRREFDQFKSDIRGKSLKEIGRDKIEQMKSRSKEIQDLETRFNRDIERLKNEIENGLLKTIRDAARQAEDSFNREKRNAEDTFNREKKRVEDGVNGFFNADPKDRSAQLKKLLEGNK